jgi:tetratricopeptide (TPR) repeat protein
MKNCHLLLGVLLLTVFCNAQKIHEPSELFKLMAESPVKYGIQNLKTPIPSKDYSKELNQLNCYRVIEDSSIHTVAYNLRDSAQFFFKKAEALFGSNPDSSLYYYTLMRTVQPELYFGLTYSGQLFERKGDLHTAIAWYEESISKNYIDYMAHWFLADAYAAIGELDKALDEIVIAQILNRNNERIKKSMTAILKKAKLKYEDWYFTPQIELKGTLGKEVSISIDSKWLGYGLAKAFWEFEPGYRQSMGVDSSDFSITEYKECLYCLLVSLENSKLKIKTIPQLRILREAALNKYLNEYILYEVLLPEHPFAAFQLTEKNISDIKDYILNVRYKK